jgi:hypothetical protein
LPKRGKLTKQTRDRGMIAGIRKHRALFDAMGVGPEHLKADDLIARFEAHLQVIDDIDRYDKLRSQSIALEAKLEKAILALWHLVSSFAVGSFGEASLTLRDFALKPRKPPTLTVVTKAIAVAKRRETRRLRRTMGKRQRKAIKGTP